MHCTGTTIQDTILIADEITLDADLTNLDVSGLHMQDPGICIFSCALGRSFITCLNMSNCSLSTCTGIPYLADALQTSQTLTDVNLSNNALGLASRSLLMLARALEHNTILRHVSLASNEIGGLPSSQEAICALEVKAANCVLDVRFNNLSEEDMAVSYTHLTLPTICSV